ncbi:MAG: hypothetical protein A2161_00885 [Candidatus Schekmanbacteria bacterium RBG_13_48_7]|uniref:Major facilitator superfamily (MFS) profile domain-containing protein n=1 Tax=Candidatus Schekmanbacteria bacterium RBG_13_48_7 TaxID=1817878 RepID=A0A1F7RWN0_9BACT|nr:MAG: hypothetical protein A2161_00885 [Candidatus Schekmanbacteria bacterium RBG_13_48_7]
MLKNLLSIILDENFVEKLFLIVSIIAPVAGFLSGYLLGRLRNRSKEYCLKGVFFGFLGTLNYFLYKMYSYFVRYDPETGSVGLHQVKTLLLNVGIFIILGIILGLIYRLLFKRYEK